MSLALPCGKHPSDGVCVSCPKKTTRASPLQARARPDTPCRKAGEPIQRWEAPRGSGRVSTRRSSTPLPRPDSTPDQPQPHQQPSRNPQPRGPYRVMGGGGGAGTSPGLSPVDSTGCAQGCPQGCRSLSTGGVWITGLRPGGTRARGCGQHCSPLTRVMRRLPATRPADLADRRRSPTIGARTGQIRRRSPTVRRRPARSALGVRVAPFWELHREFLGCRLGLVLYGKGPNYNSRRSTLVGRNVLTGLAVGLNVTISESTAQATAEGAPDGAKGATAQGQRTNFDNRRAPRGASRARPPLVAPNLTAGHHQTFDPGEALAARCRARSAADHTGKCAQSRACPTGRVVGQQTHATTRWDPLVIVPALWARAPMSPCTGESDPCDA